MSMEHILGKKYFSTATSHATLATAKQETASGNRTVYITDIAGSSDKAGAVLWVGMGASSDTAFAVQLGSVGTNTPFVFSHAFQSPLIASGTPVLVEVDGTVACWANISGFIA